MWVLKWKEQIVHSQTKSGGPYKSSGVALKILFSYYISQFHNKLSFNIFNISGHTSVDILADSLTVPTNFVPPAVLRRTEVTIKYLNCTSHIAYVCFPVLFVCMCPRLRLFVGRICGLFSQGVSTYGVASND
jgi:hypothetical protein